MSAPRLVVLALTCASLAGIAAAQRPVPVPPGNPITQQKALLGKALFFEEQLSSTRAIACATCHMPAKGGGDPRVGRHPGPDGQFFTADDVLASPGVVAQDASGDYTRLEPFPMRVQVTGRQAPPVVDSAFAALQFWDGRAGETFADPATGAVLLPSGAALENQVLGPPLSPVEMAHFGETWAGIVARIRDARPLALASDLPDALATFVDGRSYPDLFELAFGSRDVTVARIAMAVATYERTLVSWAPIDDFRAGNMAALTMQERRGLMVFQQTACATCHGGENFQFDRFDYIGVRPRDEDIGREAVTHDPGDRGAFKVPTLRNVALRAPYFHNGGKATLEEVVDFYKRGGDFPNTAITRQQMNGQDRNDLVAFLRGALTDPRVANELPPFDRPTLWSERTGHHAEEYGAGVAGSGGWTPRWVAVEPAWIGNSAFSLGVGDLLGRAPLFLIVGPSANPTGTSPVPGLPLWVGVGGLVGVPLGSAEGDGPGIGHRTAHVPVPSAAVLDGVPVHAQVVAADAAAPAGFSTTPGLRVPLFAGR